ncbi:slit homolog 2 protein-like protein [Lates japonicus]|uniref:Slit homolog 2 protein-like protein n=1 Tax=Lates japonicus TaxID=270547 RepID=A0AAD3R863_LATJO|nr:slit homolog 2 protein-like protein [Lates japonicus]
MKPKLQRCLYMGQDRCNNGDLNGNNLTVITKSDSGLKHLRVLRLNKNWPQLTPRAAVSEEQALFRL